MTPLVREKKQVNNEERKWQSQFREYLEILRHCVLCFKCTILFHPHSNPMT